MSQQKGKNLEATEAVARVEPVLPLALSHVARARGLASSLVSPIEPLPLGVREIAVEIGALLDYVQRYLLAQTQATTEGVASKKDSP